MRRWKLSAPMIILALLLSACGGGAGGGDAAEQLALDVRAEYIAMEGCAAALDVTADYGERVYQYTMDLTYAKEGDTLLTVTAPENIAGVSARLTAGQTALEYEGVRLETGPLSEDGMSPVDAVPALLAAAREGFLAECVLEDQDGVQVLQTVCRDPEASPGVGLEYRLWYDAATHALLRGEVARDGYTVVQCVFTSFTMT